MAEIKDCGNCKHCEITANNEYPCSKCDENYSLWESLTSIPDDHSLTDAGKLCIAFHLWMKKNDTPERAAEWFHYSDEDMYREFINHNQ